MAEDLNNLFENFENKSLEELGSSLLSRQAEINKAQAKEARKSRRIGQALAVMGVGQKIFKNAYDKRIKELDKQELFLLSNNENQAKEVAQLGRIMEYMPDEEWAEANKGLDINTKVRRYLEEHDGDGLSVKFKPVIDALIKQDVGEEYFNAFKANTDTYETAYDSALHEVLKDYLKINPETGKANYLGFEDELRGLLQEQDMDRLDLFKKARSLSAYDLTQAEKRLIAERKLLYRNRGLMNTFKDGLAQIGLRQEKKGGLNLFKSIDETNLAGGNLNDVLNNLDLGGIVIGSVDRSMAKYRNTFESLTDAVKGDAKLFERAKVNLASFDQRIRKARVYDSDNKYKMTIRRGAWNNYYENIIEDDFQVNEWVNDIAAVSLAFKNDVNFAERVYIDSLERKGIPYTETDLKNFRNKINSNEQFRLDIATSITAREGFRAGGAKTILGIPYWSEAEYYDPNTDQTVYEKYEYNRNKGDIPALLGEGIVFKKNKYVTDDSWDAMTKEAQQDAFDLKFKEIAISKNISGQEKIIMFEKLFNEIPNPYDASFEEYIETIAPDIVRTMSSSQRLVRNDDGTQKSLMDIFF